MTYPRLCQEETAPPAPLPFAPGRVDDRRRSGPRDAGSDALHHIDRAQSKIDDLSSWNNDRVEAIPFPVASIDDDGPCAA